MSKLGRNSLCACGSGRKAKKCHPDLVGLEGDIATWAIEMKSYIESRYGYVEPMSDEERSIWKHTGCPYAMCEHDTMQPGEHCAAPNCGV
jgi:uncharacterized protein YecA (UPF0149 family)